MSGNWQKDRPEWATMDNKRGLVIADGDPMIVSGVSDPKEYLLSGGLLGSIFKEEVEWWWSEPIEVPPMPKDAP